MTKILIFSFVTLIIASVAIPQDQVEITRLNVTTTPTGATILCDGIPKGVAPVGIANIKPGKHLITATLAGYHEIRKTVMLRKEQMLPVSLKMEPLTGLIIVHSNPTGATIQINGADRGKTPLLLADLPIGEHRMGISITGYRSKEKDIRIISRTPRKIDIDLTSDSATLILSSTPSGANVVINGILKGQTPCTIKRIQEGNSTIEMTMEGCESYKQTLKLVAGETQTLQAILNTIPAELKIVSIPTGARIYVNNEFRGETPVIINDLKEGSYRVRAELTAHKLSIRTIEIKRAQRLVEEFRLQSNSGLLEIVTEPAGISIFVDGKEIGKTSAKEKETDRVSQIYKCTNMSVGEHEVQLSKKGFFSKKFNVIIAKDKTITKHIKLARRFIPDYEVTTPSRVYQGVLIRIEDDGSIKLETRPGVTKNIDRSKIRAHKPIRVKKPGE
ncbi:MAG: PEGA domain-containing protein [Kiritimatiellae bacterium]|nr:PEGA domain-containing protein [Kiritimatiellia bacterium]